MNGRKACSKWLDSVFLAALFFAPLFASADDWKPASGLMVAPGVDLVKVKVLEANVGSQKLTYSMPAVKLSTNKQFAALSTGPSSPDPVRLSMGNAMVIGDPGKPMLPMVPCKVMIPQGHEIDQVSVTLGDKVQMPGTHAVEHGQKPYPLVQGAEAEYTEQDEQVYGSDDVYPAARYKIADVQKKRGVTYAYVVLNPVEYKPKSGDVSYYPEMTVSVTTKPKVAALGGSSELSYSPDRHKICTGCDNPELLSTYTAEPAPEVQSGARRLKDAPDLPCTADDVKYLIVTSAKMRDTESSPNLWDLVTLKENKGLTATIVTIEDINGAYTGVDDAETLRNFLIDAYANWGVEYVLLGGDTDVVPMRYLWVDFGQEADDIPSDLYFQCLDGEYNSNGNDKWGEPDDGTAGANVDMLAEVYIGRASAETEEEMANFVTKIIAHENADDDLHMFNALMVGEHLGFGGVSEYAKASMEEIRLGSSEHGYTTLGFASDPRYTTDTLYEEDQAWTKTDIVALINSSTYAVFNHLGHCNTDYCMKFYNGDADLLSNNRYGFLYSQGCIPGAFDRDCLGEHLTTSNTNGMYSVVLNARYGWGQWNSTDGASQRFNRPFWHAYFSEGHTQLGVMNAYAHEYNIVTSSDNSIYRWCYVESNLLGDPEVSVDSSGLINGIRLDRDGYRSDATVRFAVQDGQANPATNIPVAIAVEMPAGGNRWTSTVYAVNVPGTIQFTNSFSLTTSVSAVEGDLLRASFVDVASNSFEDTAIIDDTPPVLTNLHLLRVSEDTAVVGWYSDEISDSRVMVTEAYRQPGYEVGTFTAGYATNMVINNGVTQYFHEVEVTGLTEFSRYYAAAASADYAGNTSSIPADLDTNELDDYLVIITQGRRTAYELDFDSPAYGWGVTNIGGGVCWQQGRPLYGPNPKYEGDECWGTVLAAHYPHLANAWVYSPAIFVNEDAVLTFKTWYDIEPSEDYRDAGFIEVNNGEGWQNVYSGTYIRGESDGWEEWEIDLSQFTNESIRVRFRLESDSSMSAAGWYIDDFKITHTLGDGIYIIDYDVRDTVALSAMNDDDGFPEVGETFYLDLTLYNANPTNNFYNMVATASITTEGITLDSGQPSTITYKPFFASGSSITSSNQLQVTIEDDPSLWGDEITLMHTAEADNGGPFENTLIIEIQDRKTVSGVVTDLVTGVGIPSAEVFCEPEDEETTTTMTDASGNYSLPGMVVGGSNLIWASKIGHYSPSDPIVIDDPGADQSGVDIGLGKAIAAFNPTSLYVRVLDNQISQVTNFVISNTDSAANIPLKFAFDEVTYGGQEGSWLTLSPLSGSIDPGNTTSITVTIYPTNMSIGVVTNFTDCSWNDIYSSTGTIPIIVSNSPTPELEMLFYYSWEDTGDGDGYIEAGETAILWVWLYNSGQGTARTLSGVLTPDNSNVTVPSPNDTWLDIDPGYYDYNWNGFTYQAAGGVTDGDILPMTLTVTDGDGRSWQFSINEIVEEQHELSGTVTATNGSGIGGVDVEFRALNNSSTYSDVTLGSGSYSVYVPSGTYVPYLKPPSPYKSLYPASPNVVVAADTTEDFVLQTVTNLAQPYLQLVEVEIVDDDDGDGTPEPGETVELAFTLYNHGWIGATNIISELISSNGSVTVYSPITNAWGVIEIQTQEVSSVNNTININSGVPNNTELWLALVLTNEVQNWGWELGFTITSKYAYAISGTVTDPDGNPLEQINVEIVNAGVTNELYTDPNGYYKLGNLDQGGNYTVTAIAPFPYVQPAGTAINNISADETIDIQFNAELYASPSSVSALMDENRYTTQIVNIINTGVATHDYDINIKIKDGLSGLASLEEAGYMPTDWTKLESGKDYVPGKLIVRFKGGTTPAEQLQVLKENGMTCLRRIRAFPAVIAEYNQAYAASTMAGKLEQSDIVMYTQPDYIGEVSLVPNDTRYPEMYALDNTNQTGGTVGADINAEAAWDVTTGSSNVIVGVADTGVDIHHTDLAANIWSNLYEQVGDANGDGYPGIKGYDDDGDGLVDEDSQGLEPGDPGYLGDLVNDDDENGYNDDLYGYDFADDDNDLADDHGHGTHVSGTIAAVGNNSNGIAGVSWNSKIMGLKIGNRYGQIYISSAIEALDYSIAKGVKLSNHSWGGPSFSPLLYEMIGYAYSNDHVVVCAAGNDAVDVELTPMYPASYNHLNVISVASGDHNDEISYFSNYGKTSVDLMAPGENILSTIPDFTRLGNDFDMMSGTSMAAPHVSGVVALLLSISPWANVDMLTTSIFQGVRYDERLEEKMAYPGHLDAAASIGILQGHWINVTPATGSLPPGTTPLTVSLNTTNLITGTYEADICVTKGPDSLDIPVSLTVLPGVKPTFVSVTVDDDPALPGTNDGDGYAEPGEQVNLYITMGNEGSAKFTSPAGDLSTVAADVTINTASMTWPEIRSSDQEISITAADVTFGLGVASVVPFMVTVSNGVDAPWSFNFNLPVEERHSITGHVSNTSGQNISGARVEYWGEESGIATTGSDGSYAINDLEPGGSYDVRVLAGNYAKSSVSTISSFVGGVGAANFVLQAPSPIMSTNRLVSAVQLGKTTSTNIVITNSSLDSFSFECYEMPYRTVTVISDEAQLVPLVPELKSMGLQVTSYTNNYALIDAYYSYGAEWLLTPAVYYSDEDVLIFSNDLVIVDISGFGEGRLLLAEEQEVFSEYMERGGKVIFTGRNMLSTPDDYLLASLIGSDDHTRDNTTTKDSLLTNALPDSTYVNISPGDTVYTHEMAYDNAVSDTNSDPTVYFTAGDGVKILRNDSFGGGVAYYWDGNDYGSDWTNRSVWLDVLKNLIMSELQEDVDWLTVSKNPASGIINSGDSGRGMDIVLNPSLDLEVGDHRATILLKGNYTDSDDAYVHVNFCVTPPILEVKSSTGVTNWMGDYIAGNGTETSSVFQVILTGPDDAIDPPRGDGGTTGDDILLAQYPYGEAYGRFGTGYPLLTDSGRFKVDFEHDLSPSGDHYVYVRAWDAMSYKASVAYGESGLYNIQQDVGESYDFGTWGVDTAIGYPDPTGNAPDSNGDTVPDGWYIGQGMDPRAPIELLSSTGSVVSAIVDAGLSRPGRVVFSDDFIFVLNSQNHSVAVYDRSTQAYLSGFGSPGTGDGKFNTPQGLAIDPRSSTNRLAVADTLNDRIQILKFDPGTGALSFESKFGTVGVGDGQFDEPHGVAFDDSGWIYVADKKNNRIQTFEPNGIFYNKFGVYGTAIGKLITPKGLCVDADGLVWVADTGNHRIQVFTGGGANIPSYKIGSGVASSSDGNFNNPTDVKIGVENRIFVCDEYNHRIQVFDSSRNHLFSYGVYGLGDNELNFPQGVCPETNSAYFYIADTRNDRVTRVEAVVDSDNDGMDDVWEANNGLNASTNDAMLDLDGDGVSNIGEYRIGLDPQDSDSNNNGGSDGWDLANGIDPSGAGSPVTPPNLVITTDTGGESRYVGQTVTITATYDESTASSPVPQISLSGGATLSETNMSMGSATVWNYTYTVQSGDAGDVDVTISGAEDLEGYVQDPNPSLSSALFLIEDVEFVVTNTPTPVETFNGLTWPVVSGGVYQVQYLFDWTTTNWMYTPDRMTSTVNGAMSWTNTAPTNDFYFYRVIRHLQ